MEKLYSSRFDNSLDPKGKMNRVCGALLAFVVILLTVQYITARIMKIVTDIFYFFPNYNFITIIDSLTYAVSYIASYFVFKRIFGDEIKPVKFTPTVGKNSITVILASIAIILSASRITSLLMPGVGSAVQSEKINGIGLIILVITSVVVPAFFEELMFRGFVMTNLLPSGRNFAIVTSGILFGLIHGNHDQILFATVSGIVLGWVYAETGSIWCGIIIHFANNLIRTFENTAYANLDPSKAEMIFLIVEVTLIVTGTLSLIRLVCNYNKEKQTELSGGCFGHTEHNVITERTDFQLNDYFRSFLAPTVIVYILYVILKEIYYVFG